MMCKKMCLIQWTYKSGGSINQYTNIIKILTYPAYQSVWVYQGKYITDFKISTCPAIKTISGDRTSGILMTRVNAWKNAAVRPILHSSSPLCTCNYVYQIIS